MSATRKSGQPSAIRLGGGPHVRERRFEGRPSASAPLRRVRAKRLADREANEGGAIGHIRRGAVELRVGEEVKPGPEGRAIGLIGEPHLRGGRGNHEGQQEAASTEAAA